MSRICSICREAKPESEFRYMAHKGYYNSYCKDCERWYRRIYMRAYREKKSEGFIYGQMDNGGIGQNG